MKFLLDMGISAHVIPELQSEGHEAVHIAELSGGRLGDPKIFAKARDDGYVLLVHDLDFTDLVAASGDRLPSAILFRLRDMRPENVLVHLKRVITQSREALERGAIVSVREGTIRVRTLPIGTE